MRNVVLTVTLAAAFSFTALPPLPADADTLATLTEAAVSDDTDGIRAAIVAAGKDSIQNPALAARLLQAYFRYFDELAERKREKDREWAADAMHAIGGKARKAHPENAEVRYWAAMGDLAYLQTYTTKALFIAGDVMDEMELVRKREPAIDDWGPDRVIGILYFSLPGWPLSRGNNEKAVIHLKKAAEGAPHRAVNRMYYAKALAKDGQAEKANGELAFLEKGEWKVSSPHWRKITEKQIREFAAEVR